jgi:hypothetical protein
LYSRIFESFSWFSTIAHRVDSGLQQIVVENKLFESLLQVTSAISQILAVAYKGGGDTKTMVLIQVRTWHGGRRVTGARLKTMYDMKQLVLLSFESHYCLLNIPKFFPNNVRQRGIIEISHEILALCREGS